MSQPLSLLVWEVLESRNMARLSQICFLRLARSLAMERSGQRNHAGLQAPEPPTNLATPVHSSCGRKMSQIPNLFPIYPYARDRL